MKKTLGLVLAIILATFSTSSFAQIRKIPAEVTDAFAAKYPDAKEVEWKDKLTNFQASFSTNDEKYVATFSNKGEWKNTEHEVEESELPAVIKDSYSKSKYADWKILHVVHIENPNNDVQYRVEIGSGDIKKRNLLFNTEGRLLKDGLTL